MSKDIVIRQYVESDFDWALSELKIFADFFDDKMKFIGSDTYIKDLLSILAKEHVFYVAESESKGLMGMVIGTLYPHMFNPALVTLAETIWWVPEKHRGSRAGLLLLNKFIEEGKKKANVLIYSLQEKSPVNERCLTKKGFIKKEKCFFMGVQ